MTTETLDLGHGHTLRWATAPDAYADLPGAAHCSAVIRHPLRPTDELCAGKGYCEGGINIDNPAGRAVAVGGHHVWQLVSDDPLTLAPSLLCHEGCRDHGHITGGRWIPA